MLITSLENEKIKRYIKLKENYMSGEKVTLNIKN